MKDCKKVASKIEKMGKFSDIHNCGYPTRHFPVNLYFEFSEPKVKGYAFYIAYDFGKWSIDYSLDSSVKTRVKMQHIRGIKTDREMYEVVQKVIYKIRERAMEELKMKEHIDIKNLSQLKRVIEAGNCFTILNHKVHPEYTGQIRKPNIIQTNGVYTVIPGDRWHKISMMNERKGCWLAYGKAKDWEFNNGVCTLYHSSDHSPDNMVFSIIFEK